MKVSNFVPITGKNILVGAEVVFKTTFGNDSRSKNISIGIILNAQVKFSSSQIPYSSVHDVEVRWEDGRVFKYHPGNLFINIGDPYHESSYAVLERKRDSDSDNDPNRAFRRAKHYDRPVQGGIFIPE